MELLSHISQWTMSCTPGDKCHSPSIFHHRDTENTENTENTETRNSERLSAFVFYLKFLS